MKQYLKILLAIQMAVVSFSIPALGENELPVIPKPRVVTRSEGEFRFTDRTVIVATKDNAGLAQYAREVLGAATGINFPTSGNAGRDGAIVLEQTTLPSEQGSESYQLSVTPRRVTVRAQTAAGLFYGIQTLRQLLPTENVDPKSAKGLAAWAIPCVEIQDNPRFAWRGLMMDCSRTFQSIPYLKKTIDLMAMYKMNVLHLHLTDDQGWRVEIKKYPELTRKGARFSEKWNEPESHQGFYSQAEIKDLVAYAQARNVTIVPEIELPGHTLAVLACYPELSCTGGSFEINPYKKGPQIHPDIFCAGNEKTFEFLENVMMEVMELFPSEYIHIGGDEAPKDRWKACPKCQQRMKGEGLGNEKQLQSYFVNRMGKFLGKHGRKYMGWDEILGGGLSPDAAIMSWRGMGGGLRAAASGRKAVMTPASFCYFDYTYKSISTEKAYSFEPVPDNVKKEDRKNILGLQANFWSHLDREPELVDRQLWPRLIAIAERGWSDAGVRDWEDFHARLVSQYPRLTAAGVSFQPPSLDGSPPAKKPAK